MATKSTASHGVIVQGSSCMSQLHAHLCFIKDLMSWATLSNVYSGHDCQYFQSEGGGKLICVIFQAGFAGISELFQVLSVWFWLRSRGLGKILLHRIER